MICPGTQHPPGTSLCLFEGSGCLGPGIHGDSLHCTCTGQDHLLLHPFCSDMRRGGSILETCQGCFHPFLEVLVLLVKGERLGGGADACCELGSWKIKIKSKAECVGGANGEHCIWTEGTSLLAPEGCWPTMGFPAFLSETEKGTGTLSFRPKNSSGSSRKGRVTGPNRCSDCGQGPGVPDAR